MNVITRSIFDFHGFFVKFRISLSQKTDKLYLLLLVEGPQIRVINTNEK
jgi:hypothetical protein